MKLRFLSILLFVVTVLPALASQEVTYCYGNINSVPQAYGTQKVGDYDVAILLNDPSIVGAKVKGFVVPFDQNADASGFSAWLSKELKLVSKKNSPDIVSVEVSPSGNQLSVTFPEPYTVTADGVYVGYSFTINSVDNDASRMPVQVYAGDDENGLYMHMSKKYLVWKNCVSTVNAVSAIKVILEGDFMEYDCSWTGLSSIDVDSQAKEIPISLSYTSFGSEPIKSLEYTYSFNGGEEKNGQYEYDHPYYTQFGRPVKINFSVPNETEEGNNTLRLTLTGVNGKPNANKNNVYEMQVYHFNLLPVKRPLMEEYTGLWCGFCVRGIASIEYMRKKYPEDFIAVAIHTDDDMTIFDADQFPVYPLPGLPGSYVDRDFYCDPYLGRSKNGSFGFETDWLTQCKELTPLKIDVKVSRSPENQDVIVAQTEATFIRSLTGDVRLFYYLLGDGLTHPRWKQKNYYTKKDYPMQLREMDQFTQDGAEEIKGLVFNDVLIMASDTRGIEGSLPPYQDIKPSETLSHSYAFDTTKAYSKRNMSLRNVSNFRVVVGCIDMESGKVLNAAFADIAPLPVGISDVDAGMEPVSVEYFTLTGQRVSYPGKGFYIVRESYPDGSCTSKKLIF